MPRTPRATREQLGAANVPAAHASSAPVAGFDPAEDEFPAGDVMLVRGAAELMRWRGPQSVGAGPGGPATDDGGEYGITPAAHRVPGQVDARRVWRAPVGAGYPGTPPELQVSPEFPANVRVTEPVAGHAAPARHRGGPTSDDPARAAVFPLATFMRPFDKWAPENFAALDKIDAPAPKAASPYTAPSDAPSRTPSAGGGMAAPGIGPQVGPAPNTYRIIPRSWDELLINTGQGGTATVDSGRRAGGWRARG